MSAPAHDTPPQGHETRDVSVGTVAKWGIGIGALLAFTMVTMAPLLGLYKDRAAEESPKRSPLAGQYGLAQPPEPRLQIDAAADLARLRNAEQATLDGYGWVDRQAGVVHIPIERAMELVAQRRAAGASR